MADKFLSSRRNSKKNLLKVPVKEPNLDDSSGTHQELVEVVNKPSPLINDGLAMNVDVPTDMGDTSDEEEVHCTDHDHEGFTSLDDVFEMAPDQMFEELFSDSKLYREFVAARRTSDLVIGEWPDESDGAGLKCRTLTYTLALNYSIGPKTSPSTEKQIIYMNLLKPGQQYVIDTNVVNAGVPYSDNFYVINRYCITRVNSKKCRLRISSQVKYRKNCWGVVKKLIDKTAREGLYSNFDLLGQFLHKSASRMVQRLTGQRTKKRTRRHHQERQTAVRHQDKRQTSEIPPRVPKGQKPKDEPSFSAAFFVRAICFVLICLIFINSVLFYKLWLLEQQADVLLYHGQPITPPRSPEDWNELLTKQHVLQEAELRRWQQVLSSSVNLLDQMRLSLQSLQGTLNNSRLYRTSHETASFENS